MRGEGGTIPCPGCGEQHQAFYRMEGLPLMRCPALAPRAMEFHEVPRTMHGTGFVILVGAVPPPAPAEVVDDPIGAEQRATAPGEPAEPSTRRRRNA